MKVFKTTVLGMGPWCVEFPDGEIVTVKTEARANAIARIDAIDQAKGPLRLHVGEATSLVKWALHTNLTNHELQYANGDPMGKQVPVIPLADLTELVEGLNVQGKADENIPDDKEAAYEMGYRDALIDVKQRLLTQLEAQMK